MSLGNGTAEGSLRDSTVKKFGYVRQAVEHEQCSTYATEVSSFAVSTYLPVRDPLSGYPRSISTPPLPQDGPKLNPRRSRLEGKKSMPHSPKTWPRPQKSHQFVPCYGLNTHQMQRLPCLKLWWQVLPGNSLCFQCYCCIYKCRINPLWRSVCHVRLSSPRLSFSFVITATTSYPVATQYHMSLLILVRCARHYVFVFLETGRKHRNVTERNLGVFPGRSSVVRIGYSQ